MDFVVVGVFLLVYVGMILGELPRLRVDRSGIALIGAIVLIASGRLSTAAAWTAVDVSTIALLLGLMVISAQFRLAGFYTELTRRVGASTHSPARLLAYVVVAAGGLSAILANDILGLVVVVAHGIADVHVHRLAVAAVAIKNGRDDDELLFGNKVADASLVLGSFVAVYGVKVELEGCGEGHEGREEHEEAEEAE